MGSFNASLKTIGDTKGLHATVELHEGRLSITVGEIEIGNWPLEEIGLEPTASGYRLAAEGEHLIIEMGEIERFAEELDGFAGELDRSSEKRGMKKLGLFSRREKQAKPDIHESPVETPAADRARDAEEPASRIPASVMEVPFLPKRAPASGPEPAAVTATTDAATRDEAPSFFSRLVAMLDRTIDATEKRWGPLLPNWVFNRIVFVTGFVLVALAFAFRGATSVVLLVTGVVALMVGGAAYTDDVMASKLLPGRATPTHLLLTGVGLLGVGIGFGLIA